MLSHDVEAIRTVLRRNDWLRTDTVVAPSGEAMEQELFQSEWGVRIRSVPEREWDIEREPPADVRGGLLLICNTMFCSRDPGLWLRNMARVAPYALVQDLSRAARGGGGRITDPPTGDRIRYSISSHGIVGLVDEGEPFDLGTCGAPVLDCEEYFDGRKFVVVLDLRPLKDA